LFNFPYYTFLHLKILAGLSTFPYYFHILVFKYLVMYVRYLNETDAAYLHITNAIYQQSFFHVR